MKPLLFATAFAVLLTEVHASDGPPPLRMLPATCANCHGTAGQAKGAMPSLAGASQSWLAEQMRNFRDGRRPATVMHQLAKGYSDDEIARLAEHFSRLPK